MTVIWTESALSAYDACSWRRSLSRAEPLQTLVSSPPRSPSAARASSSPRVDQATVVSHAASLLSQRLLSRS